MKPINRIVVCEPIEESHGLIIYSDEFNKKCKVRYSDVKNIVKPGDTVIIDHRVASDYDSDNKLYYIHELAIKAVLK
jgi:3-mercaptopyruvate sulfurtransferase SseA